MFGAERLCVRIETMGECGLDTEVGPLRGVGSYSTSVSGSVGCGLDTEVGPLRGVGSYSTSVRGGVLLDGEVDAGWGASPDPPLPLVGAGR